MKKIFKKVFLSVLLILVSGFVFSACAPSQVDKDGVCEVQFLCDGFVLSTQNVAVGEKLDPPTLEGYVFADWYNGNKKWSFEKDTVKRDVTLVSKGHELVKYPINYVNGFVFPDEIREYTAQSWVKLPPAYESNYEFVGWYDNPEFNGQPIKYFLIGTRGEKTLYAKFDYAPFSFRKMADGSGYELLNYSDTREEVDIPALYKGEPVVAIDGNAFRNHGQHVKFLKIPSSVKHIDELTFEYLHNIENITVDEGNEFFHSQNGCIINTQTKELLRGSKGTVIPSDGSVTVIARKAFYKGAGLGDMVIPSTVVSIENDAFRESSVTSVVIPSSVEKCGSDVFFECTQLKKVEINGMIGYNAFALCKNLTEAIIGKTAPAVSGKCFFSCENLSSLTIEDGIEFIGEFAFWGCYGLKNVVIPSSVRNIGGHAFELCKNLVEVYVRHGVEYIGACAFSECINLERVYVPSSVTIMGNFCFLGCPKVTVFCAYESPPEGWSTSIGGKFEYGCNVQ